MKTDEKIIYLVFCLLGLFPTAVYYLGFFTGLSAAIFIVCAVFFLFGGYESGRKRN